jgi:NADPH-dependent glutamate synthase beta subunit-like oxidoreductase/2,4-dienoyl-CoA reductase-like NADH-dependent reductase (Old Yellow Enzyme family)
MMKYERLFSPLTVRKCTFPNRVMKTALVYRLATEDGHITDEIRERYRRQAIGGPGAIVVEAAVILPSKSSFNLRISDDQFAPELREFVDFLHDANPEVKVGLQILHFLKVARSGWRQRVEDFKPEELPLIVQQFADAARRVVAAGFDFVEMHMAHFSTLAAFLSLRNKREDEYGGDLEGRMSLPVAAYQAVRDAVGEDFPVGLRMNGEEFIKEGNTLLQSTHIARRFAEMGVDYISVSAGEKIEDAEPPPPNFPPFAGTGYSGYRMSPRWWHPDGVHVYLSDGIRKAVREAGYDVPIVIAGKIRTPELAEEILQQGKADMIGLCRALLCDPDWPVKAKEGRAGDIVICAACGSCSEADERYEKIYCARWPKGSTEAPTPFLLVPPCKAACPAGLDVQRYIDLIAAEDFKQALGVVREKITLPGVICRVCPRFCEPECNRGQLDEPIAINALKRFVVDYAAKVGEEEIVPPPRTKDERVAIIGSGPAGLTAAHDLVKMGYGVTIFEALPIAGGMMAVGIPEYRLPKQVLQADIEAIEKLGVDIKLNSPVGKNGLTLAGLSEQGYKAIFIAIGAHRSMKLNIPGEELQGVYHGVAFVSDVNTMKEVKVGERVTIIGGGNVAIDAARTALRLGAKETFILYRRSSQEMPARKEEVEAAEDEGVKIHYLAAPVKIVGKNGKVAAIECTRMELGAADDSGRRRPVPIKGSEFLIDADMVILAIGETPDLTLLSAGSKFNITPRGTLEVDPGNLATNVPGVFAGGDAVTGPATVIEAIAAGRKGAIFIDRYLRGESLAYKEESPLTVKIEDEDVEGVRKQSRQMMPTLPLRERIRSFNEVELGLAKNAAVIEASRCLQCGMHPKHLESPIKA